jgi:ribosome-binding protein aMBF1 (putative translation factor)
MKGEKEKASVPLDEVFAPAQKDPRWKRVYAEAGFEVRLALDIAKARQRARLTQAQLAEALGTKQSVISRLERGRQNLTLATLAKIAEAVHSDLVVQFKSR